MSSATTITQDAPKRQASQAPQRDVLASRLAYLTVGLPTLGAIGAVIYAIYYGLSVSDIVLFAVLYVITGLGVEGGLHRYFTHRSARSDFYGDDASDLEISDLDTVLGPGWHRPPERSLTNDPIERRLWPLTDDTARLVWLVRYATPWLPTIAELDELAQRRARPAELVSRV